LEGSLSIRLDPEFCDWAEAASVETMENFLSGAPIELVMVYIHRLPRKSAKKIANSFKVEHARAIFYHYDNPVQIRGKE